MRQASLNVHEWFKLGDYLRFVDKKVFFISQGEPDSETVVFLHGYPTSSYDFVYLWPGFTHYRRVTLDFLGFGYSDKPSYHNYSIAEQATITESLLRNLGIKKAKVVAHDYAVSVAQELVARQNEKKLTFKLESLVLLNGGIIPGAHKPRLIQTLLDGPVGPVLNALSSKFSFKLNFNAVFGKDTKPTAEEINSFWYLMNYPKKSRIAHRMLHYMKERVEFKERWVGALRDTKIPLLLINGVDDPVSGGHLADAYEKEVRQSEIIRLSGIGHYPQVEDYPAVTEHILGFKAGGFKKAK